MRGSERGREKGLESDLHVSLRLVKLRLALGEFGRDFGFEDLRFLLSCDKHVMNKVYITCYTMLIRLYILHHMSGPVGDDGCNPPSLSHLDFLLVGHGKKATLAISLV